ncbi:MAG: hypothetical protein HY290_00380 [Planctomycetia bacterium]|nr:hypothetical protein [Planctomycetia bacterium]
MDRSASSPADDEPGSGDRRRRPDGGAPAPDPAPRSGEIAFSSADPTASVEDQRRAQKREAKIRDNRSDLGIMIAKNREERARSGRESYFGFRLIRRHSDPIDPQEDFYRGAVIPIKTARKYPDLLGFLTLEYQTVYQNEKLPSRTQIVVRPGKLTTRKKQQIRRRLMMLGLIAIALGYVLFGMSFGFWPFQ